MSPKPAPLVLEPRCPGCGEAIGSPTCHFTYSTWHCWGCGAVLDSRVVSPTSVFMRDGVELTDEELSALSFSDVFAARRSERTPHQ